MITEEMLEVYEDVVWTRTAESDWTAHYYATMKHWPEHCTFCARNEGK